MACKSLALCRVKSSHAAWCTVCPLLKFPSTAVFILEPNLNKTGLKFFGDFVGIRKRISYKEKDIFIHDIIVFWRIVCGQKGSLLSYKIWETVKVVYNILQWDYFILKLYYIYLNILLLNSTLKARLLHTYRPDLTRLGIYGE